MIRETDFNLPDFDLRIGSLVLALNQRPGDDETETKQTQDRARPRCLHVSLLGVRRLRVWRILKKAPSFVLASLESSTYCNSTYRFLARCGRAREEARLGAPGVAG